MARGPCAQGLIYSSCLNTQPWLDDAMMRIIEEQERRYEQEILSVPQYKIQTDYYGFTNPQVVYKTISTEEIKKMFKKETNKMEAKKCDRCGKFYETESASDSINVLFKQEKISDSDRERYSESHNNEMRTHGIRISKAGVAVDFCPECRESFKKWFEES